MAIVYDVYSNGGIAGAPVDYSTPIATVSTLSFTTYSLKRSSTYLFGVRARDTSTGLGEKNVTTLKVVIDANGNDVTNTPLPPQHVTAAPIVRGGLRIEWAFPWKKTSGARPTGFHVYAGTGAMPDYTAVLATVAYREGAPYFRVNLVGLVGGQTYRIGVRAYNAAAEEKNTSFITAVPISQPPKSVSSLTLVGTNQA